MRIAIDARYLNQTPSPLAQYCENLIEHLSKIDEENEYIIFIHPSFPKTLRVGPNFEVKKIRPAPVSWRTFMRLHAQVERAGADMLHTLFPLAPLFYRGKLLVTVHDVQPLMLQEAEPRGLHFRRARAMVARRAFPLAIQRATWICAVSSATRDDLSALFPLAFHKTIVTHSGMEPAYRAPLEDTIRELVGAKYKLPENYLYYQGGARPSKNLAKMLTGFAYLRNGEERFANLHFVVDSPPSRWLEKAKELVRRLRIEDSVMFLDQVAESERRALYAESRALCFLCKNEGFGFPVLEAQASGTPVLAADSGALPEIAGAGALIVNPDQVPAIVDGMRQILSDEKLRMQLVEAGRENSNRFSWKKTAEQVRDIYNLLM